MATITLQGNEIHTNGELPAVGDRAPDFHLVDGELADRRLADYAGKKKLLNIVPSLDTPVCATSTKKFNEAAAAHAGTVMLMISADLPFAQGQCRRYRQGYSVVDDALAQFRQGLRRADRGRPAGRYYCTGRGGGRRE